MESRAQVLGHPIHQVAVMFPIGALAFAVGSDALHSVTKRPEFATAARQALDFGLAAAAIAAPFGFVDWLAIPPGTRAKRVGAWHAVGNLAVLGLFGTARLLRRDRRTLGTSKALAAAGFLLTHVTAWAGTELINRHGIGVHDLIGEDVPSSLRRVVPSSS
jgi:uncharacterized membrane protein